MNAVPSQYFDLPPYHVESFPSGLHCVCNRNGFNCLSFPDNPGAKFTTIENATKIAALWNERNES